MVLLQLNRLAYKACSSSCIIKYCTGFVTAGPAQNNMLMIQDLPYARHKLCMYVCQMYVSDLGRRSAPFCTALYCALGEAGIAYYNTCQTF